MEPATFLALLVVFIVGFCVVVPLCTDMFPNIRGLYGRHCCLGPVLIVVAVIVLLPLTELLPPLGLFALWFFGFLARFLSSGDD